MGPHRPKLMADRQSISLPQPTINARLGESSYVARLRVSRRERRAMLGCPCCGMADRTAFPTQTNPTEKPVADETQDLAEVRLEKLRQIEALGIDPWGHRFDNTTPIGEIRKLPAEPFSDDEARAEGPRRRPGRPLPHRREAAVPRNLGPDRPRAVDDPRQQGHGDQEWKVAQLLDLGDLIGVDGEFGKTQDRRTDHPGRRS